MISSSPNGRPRWYETRLAGAVGQFLLTILGVVAALVLAPIAPWFDQALSRWHYVEPTCADPQGLKMLDLREDDVGTLEVSSGVIRDESLMSAMHAFDARPGSGWVPETKSDEGDDASLDPFEGNEDWIALNFASPQPIALVCVINGNATDSISYMRADRVRTVDVSLSDGEQELTDRTTLRTLPEHEIQNRQDLELPTPAAFWKRSGDLWNNLWNKPSYDELKLTLSDRYTGIAIDDPNMGPGLDAPTRQVMLAEVEVWVHTEQ